MRTFRPLRTRAAVFPLAVLLALPTTAATAAAGPDAASSAGFRLPTALPEPSPWVPLVTQDPVPAAAALLPAEVAYGDRYRETGRGFVVLSADGTEYRRLPYREHALGVAQVGAISPDGRWVAQVNKAVDLFRGTGLTVTLLRLGERSTREVVLPEPGGFVRYLLFDRDGRRLFVVSQFSGSPERSWFWAVDTAAGRAELVCRCPVRLAVDGTGRVHLHQGTPQAERLGLPLYGAGGAPADGWLGSFPDALADDGSWAEVYAYDQVRVVGGGRRIPRVLVPQPGAHPVPVRLDRDRLLVAIGGGDAISRDATFRLAWVALADKQARDVLAVPRYLDEVGPLLAFDALAAPPQRPTAETGVPWWSGDRRAYHVGAVVQELQDHTVRDAGAAGVLLGVAGLGLLLRRRRRALR